MTLSRDQLTAHAAQTLQSRVVNVPEWGGDVRVRELSLGERIDFTKFAEGLRQSTDGVTALLDTMFRLVLICVVGDDGKRLFSDDDQEALRALDFDGFAKVRDAARALNNMMPPEPEAAEEETPLVD